MSEPLAVRIRHRLKYVESYTDRRLFVECLEALDGPGGVPRVPHPDGTGDPAQSQSGVSGLSVDTVIEWFAANDLRLMPWQITRMERL